LDDPHDSSCSGWVARGGQVTPLDLRRYRAERLLRKDFEGMRAKVLTVVRAQLRGEGIALAATDLEACYTQAWHGLYASVLEGEQIENPAGWLVRVTFRRAVDEHRAAGVIRVGEGEGRGSYPPRAEAGQDLAAELDDKARLRALFEGLRTRLSPREREAVSLCYLQGLTRAQAAERMGMSEARMRKLMEGAGPGRRGVAVKLGELLGTIAAGGWCEEQGSLMKAYAFGILDPDGERYALAAAHCRECPACRAHVASLRGLASVLPLPLLPGLSTGGGGIAARRWGAAGRARKSGWDPARRSATGFSRLGHTMGGSSSGLQGSIVAKLAVTVTLVFGTGYAVLGSRAHGSPHRSSGSSPRSPRSLPRSRGGPPQSSAPLGLALPPTGTGVLLHSPFEGSYARAHVRAHEREGQPNRANTTSRSRHSRVAAAPVVTHLALVPEFEPERASGVSVRTAAQSATPTQVGRAGSPSGEFGLE
jgi:RNA polymerase sigma factor (sigma-70 family)